jgi:hypothetical protein
VFARQSVKLAYALAVVVLVTPVSVWATDGANLKLPPNKYGCQACHGSDQVTPTTVPAGAIVPLTALGLDWLSQSPEETNRLWSDLAISNVDGDGCSNGFELGDPAGAYQPDGTLPPDKSVSDPNQNDCTLPISDESWSRLKSLFDGN